MLTATGRSRTYDQASLGLSFVQGDGVDPERQGGGLALAGGAAEERHLAFADPGHRPHPGDPGWQAAAEQRDAWVPLQLQRADAPDWSVMGGDKRAGRARGALGGGGEARSTEASRSAPTSARPETPRGPCNY